MSRSILILEPESSGIDLVATAAELGLFPHVFDRRPIDALPEVIRAAVGGGRAAHTMVDTLSVRAVAAAVAELERRVEVAAIVPGFEYAVPVAAEVAAATGLPTAGPESADDLSDKERMNRVLSDSGILVASAVPLQVSTATDADLLRIAGTVGFPAVVKPVNGCGSVWVRRVDDLDGLRAYLDAARAGPLNDMGRLVGERLLVESYVVGPEYSVEGYVTESSATVVAVTEKSLGPEPHFVEVGHVVQADVAEADRRDLEAVAHAAVKALALVRGVFHLEARLTGRGPVVLEVAARLGGDRIHRLVSAVTGCHLPAVMISCLAGLELPSPARPIAGVAASRFFTVPRPGRITDPAGLRRALGELPGCLEMELSCSPGERLVPATDFRQRFGHVVLAAADRTALSEVSAEAARLVSAAIERTS
ncbi:MAG TPA: ATP-grasp domain-containing protein [Pseudonocardiaceae bacterium]